MLKTILSIAGKPGLYKLVSQGKNMLIVESLIDGRRSPAYGNDKIVSLGDISMFTNADDVPLRQVLKNMLDKEQGAEVAMDFKKAKTPELFDYLEQVLPDFDRDRVHPNDVRKLISWYNILVKSGNTDFEEAAEEPAAEAAQAE